MKKCPLCQQIYDDETNFCLSDGSTLVSVSDSFASESEIPTIVNRAAPTVYSQPQTPSYNNAPVSSAPAETKGNNTFLIAAIVGLIALVIGGAVVGLVMYGVFKTDNKNTANIANVSNDKTNKSGSAEQKSETPDEAAENLKRQQEKLDKDKQKLEEERKRLEAQKKEAAQTPKPSSATTAVITDPPTNIRATPNGTIICVMRQRGTVVNILGPTGVSDNNGTWYYTDACGKQGVIHSSQIRF